tara:strand:- start:1101 stop:1304 length:204 start_codon:yes stop_codon:yes gene_type:complete
VEGEMLSHKIYEKLSNIISQSAINSLLDTQVEALEEELSKLVQKKNGDINEISYDDLLVAWENATRI